MRLGPPTHTLNATPWADGGPAGGSGSTHANDAALEAPPSSLIIKMRHYGSAERRPLPAEPSATGYRVPRCASHPYYSDGKP